MTLLAMGSCCPDCGCCDFYCADCYDKHLPKLEAIADAAQALRENGAVGRSADARWGALIDALDAYDALNAGDIEERGHIVAIMGGGDWCDASVEHLIVPSNMDLGMEHRAYRDWYHQQYCPALQAGNKIPYLDFSEWLVKQGARQTTDDDVLEFWQV